MDPLLEAVGLSRRHPSAEAWLLEEVSLKVARGMILGIMGPSGSGKTLLLRSLAWLDPIDAGEIRFEGKPVDTQRIPSYRGQVVYAHQTPCLMAGRVEHALRRPFELKVHEGRQYDRQRILDYLDLLGADPVFLNKPISELSGGESQLVALMRAIQLDPAILLLDEPTAALDSHATQTVERLIRSWLTEAQEHRAAVWVTHVSEQTERVAERVIHLSEGRIQSG